MTNQSRVQHSISTLEQPDLRRSTVILPFRNSSPVSCMARNKAGESSILLAKRSDDHATGEGRDKKIKS